MLLGWIRPWPAALRCATSTCSAPATACAASTVVGGRREGARISAGTLAMSASAGQLRRKGTMGAKTSAATTVTTRWSGRWNTSSAMHEPRAGLIASAAAGTMVAVGGRSMATTAVAGTERLPTNDDTPELVRVRHSAAHIMAMAVQRLFEGAQVTVGPWVEDGFYYDFAALPRPLTVDDLKRIKSEMRSIIKARLPIRREAIDRDEARRRIVALGEPFKLEILDDIPPDDTITVYHIGDQWWDLCAGPHVENTGDIDAKALDLTAVSSAYWRGDASRESLQRVYGTAWLNAGQLKRYKAMLEEAKKRDHRVLGKRLDLFSVQERGLVFWHPRGASVRTVIENFWRDAHTRAGYDLLYTPHVAGVKLWETSGHLEHYSEDMFERIEARGNDGDDGAFQLKPMNCPFHCLVYKSSPRSYRDLPIRWAELGTVYRYEKSGTLHGLMRVRGFTQDDAHIFCLPEQLEDEIVGVLDLCETVLSRFGFVEYDVKLSTRPESSVGGDEVWSKATAALEGALRRKGWSFGVDEGGGAFYGPKIDVKIRDALGRSWQCSTIQCDFNLPERFDLEYAGPGGGDKKTCRPIMVHRAIFGSLERFFGMLIEDCAGELPLWLAPVQLRLLVVSDDLLPNCRAIEAAAKRAGIRVEVDRGGVPLPKQIREAERAKVPLMGIVGAKEAANGTVSLRSKALGDVGEVDPAKLIEAIISASEGGRELSIDDGFATAT